MRNICSTFNINLRRKYVFDIIYKTRELIERKGIHDFYAFEEKIINDTTIPIMPAMKRFYDISQTQSLFSACNLINEQIKGNLIEYNTDGFIFTPKSFGVGMTLTDKKIKSYKHTWEYSFK